MRIKPNTPFVQRSSAALLLSAALVLGACQPTPEQEIVAGKDGEQLESIIAVTNSSPSTAAPEQGTGPRTAEESTFTARYTPEENMTFTVDATVTDYPGSMPVYLVQPHEITPEEAKSLADYFFQGNTAYESREVMTQAEIEERILSLTQWANDTEGLLACANNEEEAQKMKEQYEKEIAIWEERYQTAPEDYVPPECDWQFHPATYFDDEMAVSEQLFPDDICQVDKDSFIKATAELEDGTGRIVARNRSEAAGYIAHSFSYQWTPADGFYKELGTTGTQEEAVDLAQAVLEDLGMADRWMLESVQQTESGDPQESGKYAFALSFMPVIGGIPVSPIPDPGVDWEEETYAPAYGMETLSFWIADGQLIRFTWDSPLDVLSTENQAVTELSFEQIMERFETQMSVTYPLSRFQAGGESIRIEEVEMRVTQIRRGLVRVAIQDRPDAYYLLPAWSFYGLTGYRTNRQDQVDFGTGDPGMEPQANHLLTLNALDGTVIGERGY